MDEKKHKSYDWMFNSFKVQGKTVDEISNELHISRKLVQIWLKNHKLV